MEYTMIHGGGIMRNPLPEVHSFWLPYVLVDDVAAATVKARTLGATICKEVTEVAGYGLFTVIRDPTGATLALWQAKMKEK
jgi:predicted enzyme related to lactoylglutathione lyase